MTTGSSPLARGLREGGGRGDGAHWIIPARAGFTRNSNRAGTRSPGSSPLARGLLGLGPGRDLGARIIPARAGFTPGRILRFTPVGDHPRSRGVYPTGRGTPASTAGSSPLARGLLDWKDDGSSLSRIIPARAGFTCVSGGVSSLMRDHPRSRGVYMRFWKYAFTNEGSSPLARGLRSLPARQGVVGGIIPARAGFTTGRTLPP